MSAGKNLSDLEQLIEDFKRSGLRELHARHGEFEIYLSQDADAPGLDAPKVSVTRKPAAKQAAQQSVPKEAPAPTPASASSGAEASWPAGSEVIRAPYLGTFYRSPKPGAAPYVEVGTTVEADSELCLVEVMKLFTTVRAGVAGKITHVLASDGELVAAEQPLFVIAAA
ncbi:acetyl-CoA carboxylase biotin carboxyl carrier protein [Novosphingobium sp. G106]|uniref:acetyl-CoA carboxylase biotin carboxyl carrier protein n=1 Tax=Novosphingobium sp. G106 TaxID=2849500 RepID=UPI001C2D8C99|nr:acetyl-CoA carboxylase biotin carboxyl carrier protein [Novosphingobium sp. G106]MBV1689497.1 acetyl-CoA carboxylase biotin carboxyl carrier protein [Novosphingobium sp. G106]